MHLRYKNNEKMRSWTCFAGFSEKKVRYSGKMD
jgi:hypothetical protein